MVTGSVSSLPDEGYGFREVLLAQLAAELLGPRNGPYEKIPMQVRSGGQSHGLTPFEEYVTGVLAPQRRNDPRDVDMLEDHVVRPDEYSETGEDDSQDADVVGALAGGTLLSPMQPPSSMGMEFEVRQVKGADARLHVCVTWARYLRDKEEWVWRRVPRYFVVTIPVPYGGPSPLRLCTDKNGGQAHVCGEGGHDAELHVLVEPVGEEGGLWRIAMFLVNGTTAENDKQMMDPENMIFQPQIRVRLEGLELRVPGDPRGDGEGVPHGFMTSVVWRGPGDGTNTGTGLSVDPESWPEALGEDRREELGKLAEILHLRDPLKSPPFHWVDGEVLPKDLGEEFSRADIRTEYLPIFHRPAPAYASEELPAMSARELSGLDREEMAVRLEPLLRYTKGWIESLSDENLKKHLEEYVLRRISRGVDLIRSDREVWLAFAFMNRAMDIQHSWGSGSGAGGSGGFTWRPFQLAFILMTLGDIVEGSGRGRDIVDVLWVPTGAGKTEAYTGLLLFTLAYRRRRELKRGGRGDGVAALMRYTLRLLTIQQFRRLVKAIQACELLRVAGLERRATVGWLPECGSSSKRCREDLGDLLGMYGFVWGSTPFSAGLWVGGHVTPNLLKESGLSDGALELLKRDNKDLEEEGPNPAQVLQCPACGAWLSLPHGIALRQGGTHRLYWVIGRADDFPQQVWAAEVERRLRDVERKFVLKEGWRAGFSVHRHHDPDYLTVEVTLDGGKGDGRRGDDLGYDDLSRLWTALENEGIACEQGGRRGCLGVLQSARWDKPGYFIRKYMTRSRGLSEHDFDIFCPNPRGPEEQGGCPLHVPWVGGYPQGRMLTWSPPDGTKCADHQIRLQDRNLLAEIPAPFRYGCGGSQPDHFISDRVPIMALTVDEQIYGRLPSVVVATVDKFAQLPLRSETGLLFGDVRSCNSIDGCSRRSCREEGSRRATCRDLEPGERPKPPELIIQDELHLINGPLGSLVGIYEAAVEHLASAAGVKPKYVAASATVSSPEELGKATNRLYLREALVFPPASGAGRMFTWPPGGTPFDDRPGALYVGVLSPGRGPLTPVIRIWTALLHAVRAARERCGDCGRCGFLDRYHTLVGYFNAVRELAYAVGMYEQDMRQRLDLLDAREGVRAPRPQRRIELSRRTGSSMLPQVLEELSREGCAAPDAVFSTSMFGTGVDIPRLSLMVVHGQPKETSQYVQATGRVGRSRGALVVTFYRATKPRDLSHYEFFIGYHSKIDEHVEPVSVNPYTEGVAMLAGLPVLVAMLRGKRDSPLVEDDAGLITSKRELVEGAIEALRDRASKVVGDASAKSFIGVVHGYIDKWKHVAVEVGSGENAKLSYVEYYGANRHVVFGDERHRRKGFMVVQDGYPTSLRELEGTFTFRIRRRAREPEPARTGKPQERASAPLGVLAELRAGQHRGDPGWTGRGTNAGGRAAQQQYPPDAAEASEGSRHNAADQD
jgi:hypothetical protein